MASQLRDFVAQVKQNNSVKPAHHAKCALLFVMLLEFFGGKEG